MKKLILLSAFLVLGLVSFSQTQEENKKSIQSIQVELKSSSDKKVIKAKSRELRIRQQLDEAYKSDNKSLINEKMIELNGVLHPAKKSVKSPSYNTTRSNNPGRKKTN